MLTLNHLKLILYKNAGYSGRITLGFGCSFIDNFLNDGDEHITKKIHPSDLKIQKAANQENLNDIRFAILKAPLAHAGLSLCYFAQCLKEIIKLLRYLELDYIKSASACLFTTLLSLAMVPCSMPINIFNWVMSEKEEKEHQNQNPSLA